MKRLGDSCPRAWLSLGLAMFFLRIDFVLPAVCR